jgi:hypothetical protein
MEGLTVATDLPQRRPSKTSALTPSSAWSAVSRPFQSRPKLSTGVMSRWVDKENEAALAQNRKIFYVPGLTSMAKTQGLAYTKLSSSDKWEFKGIPILTVNTRMPFTGSELDLRTEIDFWDTVVPDKSPRPEVAETPAVAEQREVLFDANYDVKDEEDSDDGLTHTNELQAISPRPLSPAGADHNAGNTGSTVEDRMVFQPQLITNPHLSRTQPGRVLLSRACSCCGIGCQKASESQKIPE